MKSITKNLWSNVRDAVYWRDMGKGYNDVDWMTIYYGKNYMEEGIFLGEKNELRMEVVSAFRNTLKEAIEDEANKV